MTIHNYETTKSDDKSVFCCTMTFLCAKFNDNFLSYEKIALRNIRKFVWLIVFLFLHSMMRDDLDYNVASGQELNYSSVPNKRTCTPDLILTKLPPCSLLFGTASLSIFLNF